jgi:hypothetical protein
VFGVAREDLDAAPSTSNEPLAGRLAVFVVFSKRTLPPRTFFDDGRVFGIGTPFGLGFVCGHGLSLPKDRLACSRHAGVSTRLEEPVFLTYTHKGTRNKIPNPRSRSNTHNGPVNGRGYALV